MAYIDRDPEEMIRYAKTVDSYVSNMASMLSAIQGSLSCFESDLDDTCKGAIQKLGGDIKSFMSQVEYFNSLAKSIEAKAKSQISARDSMRGF